MLNVEQWADLRRLHFIERVGIRELSRRFGLSRKPVRRALRSTDPPRYSRPAPPSKTPSHPYIDYVNALALVRNESGLVVRTRELDRYLWLAGEYRPYMRGRKNLNTELKVLFADQSRAVRVQLAALAPEGWAAGRNSSGRRP